MSDYANALVRVLISIVFIYFVAREEHPFQLNLS